MGCRLLIWNIGAPHLGCWSNCRPDQNSDHPPYWSLKRAVLECVLSCFLARHAALPHSGFGMQNILNKWEMSGTNTAHVSVWRAEEDEWQGRWGAERALGDEGQRIYVCKSQMWAQPSLAGAAGTCFGGEQEPLLTSEWFPFVRVIHQEAKWELICPPHPTCPGICTPNSSWRKMQIHPWYGEELLSKEGVIGIPRIGGIFEGCQDLSELSWELCEVFLSVGNECSFLCFSSFPPDRHWELKCPKLWKAKVVNNREKNLINVFQPPCPGASFACGSLWLRNSSSCHRVSLTTGLGWVLLGTIFCLQWVESETTERFHMYLCSLYRNQT